MPGQRAGNIITPNFGIDRDLWAAAKAKAASEGRPISAVIREFLESYVSGT